MSENFEITLTREIDASCEELFDAWLDPKALAQFMCPAPGVTVGDVSVDAKVGGEFRIVMLAGEQELPHHGKYLEIERSTRLVFTWLSTNAGPGSEVALTFKSLESGQTLLTLQHTGRSTEVAQSSHTGGWTQILEHLGALK